MSPFAVLIPTDTLLEERMNDLRLFLVPLLDEPWLIYWIVLGLSFPTFSNLTMTNSPLIKIWGGHRCLGASTQPPHGVCLYGWPFSSCWSPCSQSLQAGPPSGSSPDTQHFLSKKKKTTSVILMPRSLPSFLLYSYIIYWWQAQG